MNNSHFIRRFMTAFGVQIAVFMLLVLSALPLHAQAKEKDERFDLFIAPLAEAVGYSREGIAYGGGAALGAGDGRFSLGFRMVYASDSESLSSFEFAFFMRYYVLSPDEHNGLFVQASGGPAALLHSSGNEDIDEIDFISFGLSVGWRFPLGNHFFFEPALRFGYPYIYGGGISAGYRW